MHFRNRIVRLSQLVADLLRTSQSGPRTEISSNDDGNGRRDIRMYVDVPQEEEPAFLGTQLGGTLPSFPSAATRLAGPDLGAAAGATYLGLAANTKPGTPEREAVLSADLASLAAAVLFGPDGLGREVVGVDFGTDTVNTNGSSDATYAHHLGVTPHFVGVVSRGTHHQLTVTAQDASSFTVRARSAAGATFGAGEAVNVYWLVIRGGDVHATPASPFPPPPPH